MPANKRQKPPATAAHQPPPPSPTTKATSKYTNKDGSKFITVPKGNSSPVASSQPSPALAPSTSADGKVPTESNPARPGSPGPTVNRKKQKRREKAAAKALAEQALSPDAQPGLPSPTASATTSLDRRSLDVNYELSEGEEEHYEDDAQYDHHPQENGTASKSKKSKKKKKKTGGAHAEQPLQDHDQDDDDDYDHDHDHDHDYDPGHHHSHNHAPHGHQHGHNHNHNHTHTHHRVADLPKRKIWNTSSQEERERIKEFWLGLGEDERKSLVKVEKDAVLRKMKEQQRQTCSCTVCGRKRTAIEDELEQLYEAYYQELEQFANRPKHQREGPPPMMSPKQHYGPGTGVHPSRGQPSNYTHQPSHGRIVEHVGDDEEEDDEEGEEYSEDELDEEEDDYSDEEPAEESHHRPDYASEFFSFGNSLTVQGGILTVADDLLKNDGKKFIEMMEQLAEKRMQREEDAYARSRGGYGHTNGNGNASYNHSNPPPEEEEEEYEDDDDDEEYEGDDGDEDYDTDKEDDMTESQRMEEGRRMFQIFAARMFEQRVLQAYKEKVAKERQEQIINEEEEEKKRELERQERKAKAAQKRKEKATQKKAEIAEAKARKEAEKAEQEAARLAEEKRKADEQRQKAEEKRKKKEALKKADEEERLRKEAERQRRLHELKEKQAELERRARETKEKEKKAKEEARLREKEARELKEREARERKEQQEREKRDREAKARTDRERADREAREKKLKQQQKQDDAVPVPQKPATATPITLARRPAQHPAATAVPALPQQLSTTTAAAVSSPQISVATPVIPLAPTPMRNRQLSQQESSAGSSASHSVSSTSQVPSPHPMTPVHTSPGPMGPHGKPGSMAGPGGYQHPPQQASPMNVPIHTNINNMGGQFGGFGGPPMNMGGFNSHGPPGLQHPPGFGSHPNQGFPGLPFGSSFPNPGMMPMPGGINRPAPGRGFSHPLPPPGIPQPLDPHFSAIGGQGFPIGPSRDNAPLHQRHSSGGGGFDVAPGTPILSSSQPRPAPIGRPGSVVQGQRPPPGLLANGHGRGLNDAEEHQYGSSALLDDSEEVGQEFPPPSARRNTSVPGPTMQFGGLYGDPVFNSGPGVPNWGQAAGGPTYFGSPPPSALSSFSTSMPWSNSLPNSSAFGPQTLPPRQNQRLHVRIRQLVCEACTKLAASANLPAEDREEGGYVSLEAIKAYVDQGEVEAPTEKALLDICETLGDATNGGGYFDMILRGKRGGKRFVRWVNDGNGSDSYRPMQRAVGLDAIGSPVVAPGTPFSHSQPGRRTS